MKNKNKTITNIWIFVVKVVFFCVGAILCFYLGGLYDERKNRVQVNNGISSNTINNTINSNSKTNNNLKDYVINNKLAVDFIATQEGFRALPYYDTMDYAVCFGVRKIKLQDLYIFLDKNNYSDDFKELVATTIFYLNYPQYAEPISFFNCNLILDLIITMDLDKINLNDSTKNLDDYKKIALISRIYNMGHTGFKRTVAYKNLINNAEASVLVDSWQKLPHKNRSNAELELIFNGNKI